MKENSFNELCAAQDFTNHRKDFNEAVRKCLLDLHLQLINLCSQPNTRWLPQLISLIQNINRYDLVCTVIELLFDVVVDELFTTHTLCMTSSKLALDIVHTVV